MGFLNVSTSFPFSFVEKQQKLNQFYFVFLQRVPVQNYIQDIRRDKTISLLHARI